MIGLGHYGVFSLLLLMSTILIHQEILAIKNKMTVDDIVDTVHVFPTMSESIKLVATSFKKNVKQLSCCVE